MHELSKLRFFARDRKDAAGFQAHALSKRYSAYVPVPQPQASNRAPQRGGEAYRVRGAATRVPLDWNKCTSKRRLEAVALHEIFGAVSLARQIFSDQSAAALDDPFFKLTASRG